MVGDSDGVAFAARYRIRGDAAWRTRTVELEIVGTDKRVALTSDGVGRWMRDGVAMGALDGATDVDVSATPFTNTLPIRRLGLAAGAFAEIVVAYVDVPSLALSAERQRYTCLEPGRRYRFEALHGDFTRTLEVDADALVVSYPGLFRRLP